MRDSTRETKREKGTVDQQTVCTKCRTEGNLSEAGLPLAAVMRHRLLYYSSRVVVINIQGSLVEAMSVCMHVSSYLILYGAV